MIFCRLETGLLAPGPYLGLVATDHILRPRVLFVSQSGNKCPHLAMTKGRLAFPGPCSSQDGSQTAGRTSPPKKAALCSPAPAFLHPQVRVTRIIFPEQAQSVTSVSKEPGHRKSLLAKTWCPRLAFPKSGGGRGMQKRRESGNSSRLWRPFSCSLVPDFQGSSKGAKSSYGAVWLSGH